MAQILRGKFGCVNHNKSFLFANNFVIQNILIHNLNIELHKKSEILIILIQQIFFDFSFRVHTKSFRPILVMNMSRMNFSSINGGSSNAVYQQRSMRHHQLLQQHRMPNMYAVVPVRSYGMLIARVVRGALKLRYLVLGGAITGGMTFNKKYEEWKDGLPDFKWLNDVLPDNEQWSNFSKNLKNMQESVSNSIELGELNAIPSFQRDCS